jgi:hypothetical protein
VIYILAGFGLLMIIGYLAVQLGLTNTKGIVDTQHDYFKNQIKMDASWSNTEEWKILKEAIKKDTDVINKVSIETGVSSRKIVAILVVEQMRLFTSEREIYKKIFAPLKILGNQSQFSWGVMGIKQETARQIEMNLKNNKSPWYLGKESENILDFSTDKTDQERFERLTNEVDRYYSYLYASILIKQLEKQWEDAGFPIENNIGVSATLYNIGFVNSLPKANPEIGGAKIEINKTMYSFGGFAQSFYNSDELTDEFKR